MYVCWYGGAAILDTKEGKSRLFMLMRRVGAMGRLLSLSIWHLLRISHGRLHKGLVDTCIKNARFIVWRGMRHSFDDGRS
jgi:hypothetical protein